MNGDGDCCCTGDTPTPTRDGGGSKLPDASTSSTPQVQIVGQRGQLPDGTPNTKGIELMPDGSLKVTLTQFPGFNSSQLQNGVYLIRAGDSVSVVDGRIVSIIPGSGS